MAPFSLLKPGWRESRRTGDGVDLQVVEAGQEGAPLVVLLHGFPEFWWAWRNQISPLADAGYHVIVPDLRGYNSSDAPDGVEHYRLDLLVADVLALANGYGAERFEIVGHDLGALITWWVAAYHSERLAHAVMMDGPHADVWRRQMLKHPTQALRSSYVAAFQIPRVPEAMLGALDFAALRAIMQGSAHSDTFEPGALDHYAEAWRRGSLAAMLNYYRALRHRKKSETPRIRVPSLIVWGSEDCFLERHVMEAGLDLCADGHFVAIDGATHWLHLEQPDRVNFEIVSFFGR
jgi:predicted alpha/beta-fold hydrolase